MRYILTVVEQLDRAARELRVDHPINNRLALILIDNAVELIIHHRLQVHLNWDRSRPFPKLSAKQRIDARGSFLKPKLNVAKYLNDVTGIETNFINICHKYRNELYHVGLRHEDIIRAIDAAYFHLCCTLFIRLPRGFRSWGSDDRYTEIAEKYVGEINFALPMGINEEQIVEKLKRELPSQLPELPASLADEADNAIEQVHDAFEFLVNEGQASVSPEEFLKDFQFHHDFIRELAREGIEGTVYRAHESGAAASIRKRLEATWRPRYVSIPLDNWRDRASGIENNPPLLALSAYQALRNDMAYLEESIMEAAVELEAAIQLEIDRRRGK
jgi:hypothetical protein